MKKLVTVLLSCLLVSLALTGCTKSGEKPDESARTSWAEANGIYKDETMEELYEAAKKEGALTIYTISSRTQKTANKFMEAYPGIEVVVKDISASELKEQYVTEYNSGIRNADILHSKEVNGDYISEVFREGILHNYKPASLFQTTDKKYEGYAPLLMELNIWFYNTEVYDTCPFTSWWELTTPEWKGRVVFQDPVSNVAYSAAITAMVQHAEEMAEDYRRVFGEDIVLAEDEPTAAHAWIKRFLANNPIIAKGSDEVIELVGAAGQKKPPVGYASSVKLRKAVESGYTVGATPNTLQVSTGIPVLNFVTIADEAPHPNAAKLFIKYWLGGEDGQGEGYKPFLSPGTYRVRPENPEAEGNIPLESIKTWDADFEYIYSHVRDVMDYWTIHR